MGRYYSGDIEGKFWFGVQNSDDASFFGGEELEPSGIEYLFNRDDLKSIEHGLSRCRKKLGAVEMKLDSFFEKNKSYSDVRLAKAIGKDVAELRTILEWYARLELGRKIHAYVKGHDECYFTAEC